MICRENQRNRPLIESMREGGSREKNAIAGFQIRNTPLEAETLIVMARFQDSEVVADVELR